MSKYSTIISWSEEDKVYVASVPELQGCMAHGKTKEEALKEIEIAKKLWIESALEDGEEVPEPRLFGAMNV